MRSRIFLIVLAFILAFSSAGCWGRKSLKELMPILAFAIDKKEDKFILTAQFINAAEIAAKRGGYTLPVTVYSTDGRSVSEAFRKLTIKVPKHIYAAHLRILIFGEPLARAGIEPVLDYFMRERESRNNFYLLVTQGGEGADVLKILTATEKIPANKIYSSLQMAERLWSPSVTIRKIDLVNTMGAEGKEAALTGILIKGKEEVGMTKKNVESSVLPAQLEIGTIGVFKKDKLIGWLNPEESSVTNAILGKFRSTVRVYPYGKNNRVSLEQKKASSKIKVRNEGGHPKIIYTRKIVADIAEVRDPNINVNDPEVIKNIEYNAEKIIKQRTENTIKKVQQEFKSDIFGFGNKILKQQPKLWLGLKKAWDEQEFPKLPVEINVKVKIDDTGTVINPITIE